MNDHFDYDRLGLKCGLEIHYQLDTKKKLFCNCPVGLRKDPHDAEIIRHMRPTLSELGEYDGTALMEFKTHKEVHYQLYYDATCSYEMDDTPPFPLNKEALDIALEIALLLNCQVADEIHVSRKQYLDGSIPTGFQRTIAVGVNGWIPYKNRKIGILQLCLEEDACREIADDGHVIVFRTDRLSTPLVEVITAPDMHTPQEAEEVDRELGRILRATGKVRRGIGTVRQDVNVSIRGGTRIEIKGVPRTGLIKNLVHYEALRQYALLSLKRGLKTRGISSDTLKTESIMCTDVFNATPLEPVAGTVKKGGVVGAVKICGFAGYLRFPVSPRRTFADEMRGRVRVIACLDEPPVLFHSDNIREVPGFPFPSNEVWKKVKDLLGTKYTDAVVIVWGSFQDVQTAMSEITIRAKETTLGIPSETRQVLKGGETDFERILPGPDRMYPDTDSAPIPIHETKIKQIRKRLRRPPAYWRNKYTHQLSDEQISQLIDDEYVDLFDEIFRETGSDPKLIATTLVATQKAVMKQKCAAGKIKKEQFIKIFKAYEKDLFPREAIPEILGFLIEGQRSVSEIITHSIEVATDEEIRKAVEKVLAENIFSTEKNPDKMISFLIGWVRRELGKLASGKKILGLLREG
jgi:glutamyl-tRNA(Gln) amidotransferase subunit E